MDTLISIIVLIAVYLIGTVFIERRHFDSIIKREYKYKDFFNFNTENLEDLSVDSSTLITSSVVIATDYFKRFIAGWINFFGGRIRTYETLLDRARREAVLRLFEQAKDAGFDGIVNIRYETSSITKDHKKGGVSAAEIFAYGTAIKLKK